MILRMGQGPITVIFFNVFVLFFCNNLPVKLNVFLILL